MFEKLIKAFSKQAEEFDRLNKESEKFIEESKELELIKPKSDKEICRCDGFCSHCKHGIKVETYVTEYGTHENYLCELDCKCSDFERVK